jgi:hypothetical protein
MIAFDRAFSFRPSTQLVPPSTPGVTASCINGITPVYGGIHWYSAGIRLVLGGIHTGIRWYTVGINLTSNYRPYRSKKNLNNQIKDR